VAPAILLLCQAGIDKMILKLGGEHNFAAQDKKRGSE
jgi:hypothetical protein